nr:MAG TPA: hypothetical protein [Caudoviricetes sp.]
MNYITVVILSQVEIAKGVVIYVYFSYMDYYKRW